LFYQSQDSDYTIRNIKVYTLDNDDLEYPDLDIWIADNGGTDGCIVAIWISQCWLDVACGVCGQYSGNTARSPLSLSLFLSLSLSLSL
jgi:hypothetical protein